jgi:hypothetical protein
MLSILAVLAAPGHCRVAAGLGMWIATRHPGVRRWRVEPVDRPQEINATTSHTYRRHAPGGGHVIPYPSTSDLSASSAGAMSACARSRRVA